MKHQAKHFFYAAGWKKFERLWDSVIRAKQLPVMTPLLEGVLSKVTNSRGRLPHGAASREGQHHEDETTAVNAALYPLLRTRP